MPRFIGGGQTGSKSHCWTHFRTWGMKNVAIEMSRSVLAYNLKRLIANLGIAKTMKAIQKMVE